MPLFDQPWFSKVKRPSRYLGGEVNSITKDHKTIEVSIALIFPDIYDVGMSHLGLKILYNILNKPSWLACERAFSPWIDLETELRKRQIPLSSLESKRPLKSFDALGFSLPHELSFTNVINMLDLSGVGFLASDREKNFPLVIAGGPACFNPEPIAEVFDAIVIGDGEQASLEICRKIRAAKKEKNLEKNELLIKLAAIPGVYIPSFFRPHYDAKGKVNSIEPLMPNYPVVKKAIVKNIDDFPYPVSQIVSNAELIHDRLSVEISRGCTRGCRFCQAGMTYRPVRERHPQYLLEMVEEALRFTGYEDISLLSLSAGDYSCLDPLFKALMDNLANRKIAVSLPSLRIDTLSSAMIEQIKRVRKTGFTLAPEAGNERLRKVINKGLTQEDIFKMADDVYKAGWNLIKLYFMIGLPTEEENDLHDIIDLAKKITQFAGKKGKRPKLNVSISTFVPKSHTPFMWLPQISLEESQKRIRYIQEGLKGSRVRVKWNQPELSWLEGIFSRGDRRLTPAIIQAWKLGAKFDAWGEHFQIEKWQKAFLFEDIEPNFYLHRDRSLDEVLPWEHIESGVSKKYMQMEFKRSLEGKMTVDCRHKCIECGVCDHKAVDPVIAENWQPAERSPMKTADIPPQTQVKYRLTFNKLNQARYFGHLELSRIFLRALRRTGVALAYSEGYHPMPKVSFSTALPVGTESLDETVDVMLEEVVDISSFNKKINAQLPNGLDVTLIENISPGGKRLQLKESLFTITLQGEKLDSGALKKFLETNHFPIRKSTKKGVKEIDAKDLIKSLKIISEDEIQLTLKHNSGPQLKPAEIVKGIFSLSEAQIEKVRILKTKQILG